MFYVLDFGHLGFNFHVVLFWKILNHYMLTVICHNLNGLEKLNWLTRLEMLNELNGLNELIVSG